MSNVNHPKHYQGKHECIDEMIALFGVEVVKHFCMCNVYKYRYRASAKNGQEDLDKADWYMDKLIELEQDNIRVPGTWQQQMMDRFERVD